MVTEKTEYLSPEIDIVLIGEDILTGSGDWVETDEWLGPDDEVNQ